MDQLTREKYKNNLLFQIKSNQKSSEAMQNKWKKFLHGKALLRQINNSVDPLITAEFDQDGNWNNKCPGVCGGQEALVGCVSVSMSQIMHYWKYPIEGEGQSTYEDNGGDEDDKDN